MSPDHLYESRVEELSGETTFGQNLENHKPLKNSKTVADRWVQPDDTKQPTWVRLSEIFTNLW
jgi:hypothetical protein